MPTRRPPAATAARSQVDRDILAWLAQRARGENQFNHKEETLLLKDAERMQDGRGDLPGFKRESMPITAQEFDRLDALVDAMRAEEGRYNSAQVTRAFADRDLPARAGAVEDARHFLQQRAEAMGLPVHVIRPRSRSDAPGLLKCAERMVERTRAVFEELPEFGVLEPLVADLESAAGGLAEVVSALERADTLEALATTRRAALKVLLLEHMRIISRWGLLLAGGNTVIQGRYRLQGTRGRNAQQARRSRTLRKAAARRTPAHGAGVEGKVARDGATPPLAEVEPPPAASGAPLSDAKLPLLGKGASGNGPSASGNGPSASGSTRSASGRARSASGNAPSASGNAPFASGSRKRATP